MEDCAVQSDGAVPLLTWEQFFLLFVQHGADVNARDHTGQSALHWTAVRGSIQVAEQLLQNGADVELEDSHGYRVRGQCVLNRSLSKPLTMKHLWD